MASRNIDTIIAAITQKYPQLRFEQLKVKNPSDDDGLWFFRHPGQPFEVQLESSNGMFPFLVETNRHNERVYVNSVAEAVKLVETWLAHPAPN